MWPYSWLGNLGLFIIASWADGNFGQKLATPVDKNLWIRRLLLRESVLAFFGQILGNHGRFRT